MKLALLLLLCASPLAAQRMSIDPDWNLIAKDSREHLVGGFMLGIATAAIAPHGKTWHRAGVVCAIGIVFEIGQADASRGKHGRGYGFGPKDALLTCSGALLAETLWHSFQGAVH